MEVTRQAPSVTELWAQMQRQAEESRRQQEEIRQLRAELQETRSTRRQRARKQGNPRVSRSMLLKGAAAGIAGVAAAEFSGSLGARPAFATTDTNFFATGGSGTGVQAGGNSPSNYGYAQGGAFYGSFYGASAFAADNTGAPNGGTGLYASSGTGYAVQGSSANGLGGFFLGGSAPIWLWPNPTTGSPTTGTHSKGEIVVDSAGVPYICSVGDGLTLGTWEAIGNLRSFPNPRRTYGNASVTSGTIVGPIDATVKKDGVTPTGVPVGAGAAYCAVQSYQPGVMTLYPDSTSDPGIANWSGTGNVPGILNLLYMLVPLSSVGKFLIHTYFTGSIYVDVWGYLV